MIECNFCHSKFPLPASKTVSRAYDNHKSKISSKQRALHVMLVVGDCILVGLQVMLVECSVYENLLSILPRAPPVRMGTTMKPAQSHSKFRKLLLT